MILAASINSFILLSEIHHHSITILLFQTVFLSASESCLLFGSFLLFYGESPRRSQSILLSVIFLAHYCGSLLFYAVLPVLSLVCCLDTATDRIPHYEYGLLLQCFVVCICFVFFLWRADKYYYVTEKELDKECESLRPDRILHPYVMRTENPKSVHPARFTTRNRSKSCDSVRSTPSAKASVSVYSLSDEILSSCVSSVCGKQVIWIASSPPFPGRGCFSAPSSWTVYSSAPFSLFPCR